MDTEGQELQNKWQEIENRIQTSRENIEQSNMKAAAANADKAIEDWKMSVLDREYLDKIQEDRVARFVSEIAKIQKEGSLAESATDVNYHTARKIEKEVENFYYEMITRRMSAEAAKETAENMLKKIAGVDTKGQELSNKWQEVENRIQLSKENIAAANITEAIANAQRAVELWNQEMLNTKYLNETQEERVAKLVSEIALLQKEGAVQDSLHTIHNVFTGGKHRVKHFFPCCPLTIRPFINNQEK